VSSFPPPDLANRSAAPTPGELSRLPTPAAAPQLDLPPPGSDGRGAGSRHGDPGLGPGPALRGHGPHRRAPLLRFQAHALPGAVHPARPQERQRGVRALLVFPAFNSLPICYPVRLIRSSDLNPGTTALADATFDVGGVRMFIRELT
jgi:hypothetical protein